MQLLEPVILAAGIFVLTFSGLMIVEHLIHRLTKNPDKSYTIGVWTFSLLAAAYTFLTSLGRF